MAKVYRYLLNTNNFCQTDTAIDVLIGKPIIDGFLKGNTFEIKRHGACYDEFINELNRIICENEKWAGDFSALLAVLEPNMAALYFLAYNDEQHKNKPNTNYFVPITFDPFNNNKMAIGEELVDYEYKNAYLLSGWLPYIVSELICRVLEQHGIKVNQTRNGSGYLATDLITKFIGLGVKIDEIVKEKQKTDKYRGNNSPGQISQ